MPTMKDVAKLAGVSVTTVSIVINGKAEERNISQETCNNVMKAVNNLGYKPNLNARKLRSSNENKPIVALYWPLDYRTHILADILIGIQSEIKKRDYECELIIEPYKNNRLYQDAVGIIQNSYNAVIIGGPSEADMKFLNRLKPQIPIVLLNRDSKNLSTISTDSYKIGSEAAELFKKAGVKNAAVLTTAEQYLATQSRTRAFLDKCKELGIQVKKSCIFKGRNSIEGGVKAADKYCNKKNAPEAIFCETDSLALGALYSLRNKNIKIPEDVKLLSVGLLSEESTKYSIPSISVISLPNNKIARTAISTIINALEKNDYEPVHKKIDYDIILRDSFKL